MRTAASLDEEERIQALRSLDLLYTAPTEAFDRITRLAAAVFQVPIALITLLDTERQWFKSRVGLSVPDTCREDAFCNYTIASPQVMVVRDAAQDPRFLNNPLVTGYPGICFYAGAPLVLANGHSLGSLCLIDHRPREFDAAQEQMLLDLAAMVVAQIELQHAVGRIDGSTHLPNRAQLTIDLEELCQASPGQQCTLILLDLMGPESLQSVMRAVGAGPLEELVRGAGRRLREFAGHVSKVYQVDMSCLALVVRKTADFDLNRFLQALVQEFREPFTTSDPYLLEQRPRLGAAVFELDAANIQDVFRRAIASLHTNKSRRPVVTWYDADEDLRYKRSYQLLSAVPHAMAHGEFSLVFQPKLDRDSLAFRGAEALLRWHHPVLGNIPPGEFIPLVESTNLIHSVTEWVIHSALAQLVEWETRGLVVDVAVNISARNLEDADFIRMMQNACTLHQVQPRRLQLECTENVALTGESTVRAINEARALGIQIALDDFGTGYCNFGSLYSLPAEALKLDQSLIRPIGTDERAREIVRSMIDLGHSLGYKLVAEGVETVQILDLLIDMGCDEIQGYYVSRPLRPEDAFARMKQQNDAFLRGPSSA
ncbi:EAL domain-containing protein [Xylophilus rhododendri]|uniref:EAL domain-containing protein n=1 Tax=Xylophilus rhododendri TaxID=2697032 RepID=A0A857IZR4_9BURK|nr:sensor domain-containing phosphodiesterase [Xylophilus rhododendri]QHI97100.1 EAL domain-containing protein [Xylophilus rhododendri]